MIYYRAITHNAVAPAGPMTGDIWIKPIVDAYQVYMYIDGWRAMVGGGIYIAETDPDTHYVNIIIQESPPTGLQMGWIWIKTSLLQAYIWLGEFVPLVGAEV
jgi:hypothetical protein